MIINDSNSLLHSKKDWLFQALIVAIIGLGIVLRASKYLPGWSMRGDELSVTHNLLERSALELITKPLQSEQVAPIGFLLLEKLLITLFGESDYLLRLPAFLAGCISLILMHHLLTKTVGKYGNLFALSAFAFGNYLIYYSSELKQYQTDVLICLMLVWLFHKQLVEQASIKDFLRLGILGALALCFSHPALFVCMAIGFTLVLHYWNDKQRLLWICLIGIFWAGVFLAIYFILLRYQTRSEYLIKFWGNLLSYMPVPPWRDFSWFPKALKGLFFIVAGLSSGLILVSSIYILGLWRFLREKNWQWTLFLIIPIGLNMIASGFQKFPFHGRLILYLLPLIFIVLGKGIDTLIDKIHNSAIAIFVFLALMILLLRPIVPTVNTYLITQSYVRDDLKPVLAFMKDHTARGDLVYLYHYTGGTYIYYAPSYNLENLEVINGQNFSRNASRYQDELLSLPRGKRIWFVFSFVGQANVSKEVDQNEREYMLNFLQQHGALMEEFYSRNNASSAHLFILK